MSPTIEMDLRRKLQEDIKRLRDIGSYRGRRHAQVRIAAVQNWALWGCGLVWRGLTLYSTGIAGTRTTDENPDQHCEEVQSGRAMGVEDGKRALRGISGIDGGVYCTISKANNNSHQQFSTSVYNGYISCLMLPCLELQVQLHGCCSSRYNVATEPTESPTIMYYNFQNQSVWLWGSTCNLVKT